MNQETKTEYIKNNWMTFANFILLLTVVFRGGYLIADVEARITENKKEINKHIYDPQVHMPFEKKIEVFVPRIELDSRLKSIEEQQQKFGEKQEKIYQLLLEKK